MSPVWLALVMAAVVGLPDENFSGVETDEGVVKRADLIRKLKRSPWPKSLVPTKPLGFKASDLPPKKVPYECESDRCKGDGSGQINKFRFNWDANRCVRPGCLKYVCSKCYIPQIQVCYTCDGRHKLLGDHADLENKVLSYLQLYDIIVPVQNDFIIPCKIPTERRFPAHIVPDVSFLSWGLRFCAPEETSFLRFPPGLIHVLSARLGALWPSLTVPDNFYLQGYSFSEANVGRVTVGLNTKQTALYVAVCGLPVFLTRVLPFLVGMVCHVLKLPHFRAMEEKDWPKEALCGGCLREKGISPWLEGTYLGDCKRHEALLQTPVDDVDSFVNSMQELVRWQCPVQLMNELPKRVNEGSPPPSAKHVNPSTIIVGYLPENEPPLIETQLPRNIADWTDEETKQWLLFRCPMFGRYFLAGKTCNGEQLQQKGARGLMNMGAVSREHAEALLSEIDRHQRPSLAQKLDQMDRKQDGRHNELMEAHEVHDDNLVALRAGQ